MRYRLARREADGSMVPFEEGKYQNERDLYFLLAARDDRRLGDILYVQDLYWRWADNWWEGPLRPDDPSLEGLYAKFVEFGKTQPHQEW